jgi:hypothetical protein
MAIGQTDNGATVRKVVGRAGKQYDAPYSTPKFIPLVSCNEGNL